MTPGSGYGRHNQLALGKKSTMADGGGEASGVLLRGLVDDAGLFPPASLPMAEALSRHQADERAGSAMLTHRFLCPASRLGELRAALGPGPLRLGLILDRGPASVQPALAEITADPRLTLELIETPLGPGDQAALAQAALAALAEVPVPVFLEPAAGPGALAAIAVLAGHPGDAGRGVKVRCGGLTASAFPAPPVLASFLLACVAADLPVKATAGLHHAVRHVDPATGFTQHGFLNLLVAVTQAVQGAPAAAVTAVLSCEDDRLLAGRVAQLPAGVARRARQILVSYGSCSTADPMAEAAALGLRPAPDDRPAGRETG